MVQPVSRASRPKVPSGVGLGLRSAFAGSLVDHAEPTPIRFLEFSPENLIGRRGRAWTRIEALRQRYPLISHGLSTNLGGTDPLDDDFLREVGALLKHLAVPWHSDHLCFCSHGGVALHDLLPLPLTRTTVQRVVDRVRRVRDLVGVPMAVENISYYVQLGRAELTETEFITRILEGADCGLLLDVNNVAINARNFGFDAQAWLADIPLERVVQLHVAGGEFSPPHHAFIDTHGSDTTDDVVALMQWVVERTGPLPVLLERDNNIPPLTELLAQVAALQSAYDDALVRGGHAQASPRQDQDDQRRP